MKLPSVQQSVQGAASAARKAIPAVKKSSSSKGPAPKAASITFTPADNGGFVSKTTMKSSRKPGNLGGPWEERQELTGQHASLKAAQAHMGKTFPQPKAAAAPSAGGKPAWSKIAESMLGKG